MAESTKDYDLFKKKESNRKIDVLNLKKITESVKYKNLLHLRPILVDKDYRVIDGQHRLEVAKALGIEIFYEICKKVDDEDIIILNNNQKRWGLDDYLNYYVSKSNENYIKFDQFIKDRKINSSQALQLFGMHGGRTHHSFKIGKFIFPDSLEKVNERLLYLNDFISFLGPRLIGYKVFLKSRGFSRAFFLFLSLPDVDYADFKKKVDMNIGLIHRCAGIEEYLEMFHEIYNYRRKRQNFEEKLFNNVIV